MCLYELRIVCLKILGKYTPEAAAMIGPLAVTMIFVGLLQALGMWALASRWSKVTLFYGALGLLYLLTLLLVGKTPTALLLAMNVTAGIAFVILCGIWLSAMRRHRPVEQS